MDVYADAARPPGVSVPCRFGDRNPQQQWIGLEQQARGRADGINPGVLEQFLASVPWRRAEGDTGFVVSHGVLRVYISVHFAYWAGHERQQESCSWAT